VFTRESESVSGLLFQLLYTRRPASADRTTSEPDAG